MANSTTTEHSHKNSKLEQFRLAFEYSNTWQEAKRSAQKISK